jgi:hypothetical protein
MLASKSNAASLKASQLGAVHRMLALNTDPPNEGIGGQTGPYGQSAALKRYYPAGSAHNQWKIMVYDTHCRSIISPLMSVSDLRSRGVTLHLLITADREPIPDVPAVYFIQPTRENISIVARDCAQGLYSRMHINFVTKLSRELMEDFAKLVVESGSGSLERVASVHDQYLDYVCFERGLFSLNVSNSYALYNSPSNGETQIEQAMTSIAYGLFSVVATKGVVPVLRCPRNGAPEMVARKLNQLIAEHPTLMSARKKGGMTASSQGSGSRPVLVILDRNEDLVTPIQHTSTYQALIDDVLIHKANRVEFEVAEKNEDGTKKKSKGQVKKYDLDADGDPFYSKHKFNTFPDAIESNGVELQRVTQKEAEVKSKTSGAPPAQPSFVEEPGTDHLASAVESLPQLIEQKKQLEVHTSILQAVMNQVAARDIPTFYELESGLATGMYKNDLNKAKSEVMAIVQDSNKKGIKDKIRLICVYSLATKCPSADIDAATNALQEAHKDDSDLTAATELDKGTKAIQYLKQLRSMQMFPMAGESASTQAEPPSSGNAGGDMLASFMARAQTQATGLLAKATEKVGTMLGKTHKHHLTLVVEHLCEQKPNSEDDTYLYLDPKVKGEISVRNLRTQGVARAPVRDVLAFMIGGGCYAEYQNLEMIANEKRSISYGTTELVDPTVFLGQLSQLS